MAWKVWGDRYTTSELTDTSKYLKVIFERNVIIRGMRTWVIVYNNPTFTNLSMKLYSNNGGVPGKLLHTSTNVITKAQTHTLANAVKEIYFDFFDMPLRAGDTYHFVLNGTGYTGSDSSHLAWRRAFPDPVYIPSGFNVFKAVSAPFAGYWIGSDL